MNILFISEALDKPEAHLIAGLKQAGVAVSVMVQDQERNIEVLREHHVHIDWIPLKNRFHFKSIRMIKDALRSHQIDIVHCLRNNRPLANAIQAIGRRDIQLVAYRGTMGNLSRLDPGSWLTYLHPRVDKLICVSDAVKHYLRGLGIPERKLTTIYKGHSPSWYEQHRHFKLSSFHIPPDAFVVSFAANMRPLKGALDLIKSAAYLPEQSKIHYLMIGEVRDPKILKAAKSPAVAHRIHLAGYQDDAWKWVGCCHVNTMPSLKREGLPRAVIEGMAQGIPAVVTRVGGMPELVEDHVSGTIVPPHKPKQLAEAFLRYEQDRTLLDHHSQAAAKRIATVFSDQAYLENTIRLYRDLLK
jgi:glycosyltransferase involved in cell wall biosynthesis